MRDLLLSLLAAPLPVQIGLALFLCLALIGAYRLTFDGWHGYRVWSIRREMRRDAQTQRVRAIRRMQDAQKYR